MTTDKSATIERARGVLSRKQLTLDIDAFRKHRPRSAEAKLKRQLTSGSEGQEKKKRGESLPKETKTQIEKASKNEKRGKAHDWFHCECDRKPRTSRHTSCSPTPYGLTTRIA